MPLLPLNRDEIGKARATLVDQWQAQRSAAAEHQRARSELDALRRGGADQTAVDLAEEQLARLDSAARASAAGWRQSVKEIADLSDRLLQGRDPADRQPLEQAPRALIMIPMFQKVMP